MFVFPLKWLPGIMAIGGIIAIFTGEVNFWSIAVTIVGCIWSYYWYFKKD